MSHRQRCSDRACGRRRSRPLSRRLTLLFLLLREAEATAGSRRRQHSSGSSSSSSTILRQCPSATACAARCSRRWGWQLQPHSHCWPPPGRRCARATTTTAPRSSQHPWSPSATPSGGRSRRSWGWSLRRVPPRSRCSTHLQSRGGLIRAHCRTAVQQAALLATLLAVGVLATRGLTVGRRSLTDCSPRHLCRSATACGGHCRHSWVSLVTSAGRPAHASSRTRARSPHSCSSTALSRCHCREATSSPHRRSRCLRCWARSMRRPWRQGRKTPLVSTRAMRPSSSSIQRRWSAAPPRSRCWTRRPRRGKRSTASTSPPLH